jgi:hypothetical protein
MNEVIDGNCKKIPNTPVSIFINFILLLGQYVQVSSGDVISEKRILWYSHAHRSVWFRGQETYSEVRWGSLYLVRRVDRNFTFPAQRRSREFSGIEVCSAGLVSFYRLNPQIIHLIRLTCGSFSKYECTLTARPAYFESRLQHLKRFLWNFQCNIASLSDLMFRKCSFLREKHQTQSLRNFWWTTWLVYSQYLTL